MFWTKKERLARRQLRSASRMQTPFSIDMALIRSLTLPSLIYAQSVSRRTHPPGRRRPSETWLRSATVSGDGRVFEFCDIVFDHFGADGGGAALRLRLKIRRADHQHGGLADRELVHALRGGKHGGTGVGLS